MNHGFKSLDSGSPDARKTNGRTGGREGQRLNRQASSHLNQMKTKNFAVCDDQDLRKLYQHYNQKIFFNLLPNNLNI